MLRKTLLSATFAVATISALVQMAAADDAYRVQATNLSTLETKVYEPEKGISYTLGSNRFVGYFEHTQGNCALTLMLFEQTAPDGTPDMSATRVRVAINPGATARIDSAEGEGVELSCNRNANAVTVSRFNLIARSY